MKNYKIALIPGDGIGPEQTEATLLVLGAVEEKLGVNLDFLNAEAGDEILKRTGHALPDESLEAIKHSDACLKGPVGESAADVIVKLRLMLDLYVNLRPLKAYPRIHAFNPNINLVFVRENTEDLYRGLEFLVSPDTAVALRVTTEKASRRIAEFAFKLATKRRRMVTIVHKSNILRLTDGLFAKVAKQVATQYPAVKWEEMYVDAAAMELIRDPQRFDVLLTPNIFGDILSDEAAQLVGGLGMAPGANIGETYGIFEPIHGSAPKIAGQQIANPCSLILTAALMFEWLGDSKQDPRCSQVAVRIETAVVNCLKEGVVTPDLGGKYTTRQVGEAVASRIGLE
ncbi:MAG: isocitrate/isopropylmalate dehydrogenase family protein [Candidatus Bathyarchaeia archaeon]